MRRLHHNFCIRQEHLPKLQTMLTNSSHMPTNIQSAGASYKLMRSNCRSKKPRRCTNSGCPCIQAQGNKCLLVKVGLCLRICGVLSAKASPPYVAQCARSCFANHGTTRYPRNPAVRSSPCGWNMAEQHTGVTMVTGCYTLGTTCAQPDFQEPKCPPRQKALHCSSATLVHGSGMA